MKKFYGTSRGDLRKRKDDSYHDTIWNNVIEIYEEKNNIVLADDVSIMIVPTEDVSSITTGLDLLIAELNEEITQC